LQHSAMSKLALTVLFYGVQQITLTYGLCPY